MVFLLFRELFTWHVYWSILAQTSLYIPVLYIKIEL